MISKMKSLVSVLLSLLMIILSVCCDPMTVKQTASGPVEGIEQTSILGQKFIAFKGIPFAEPPITGVDPYTGEEVDRRFKAPEPLKRKWTDNLIVQNFSDFCIPASVSDWTKKFSENCLFLNIYVPVNGTNRKTVMVWIYGGGFTGGDSSDYLFGPDFLLSEDNIVVTFNYRLAMYGFLNLGSGGSGIYTGNMGLKDQQLAIKWVHENIENFSGNKDEILLFGESAGATSVNHQMLNVDSVKYFKRAYLSSSSAFSPFYAFPNGNHLDKMKQCFKIEDQEKLIEFLKTANSIQLSACQTFKPKNIDNVPWGPTIENPATVGAFKIKSTDELYNSDDSPAIDTLFSFNSQESIQYRPGLVTSTQPLIKNISSKETFPLPFDGFNGTSYPEEYQIALRKLKEAYFDNAVDRETIVRQNINLMTDEYVGDILLKALVLQTESNQKDANKIRQKNTFLFRLSVHADLNLVAVKSQYYDGAAHTDDLCYVFRCHLFDKFGSYYEKLLKCEETGASCRSRDVIFKMVKMITNFARTGNPSIESDTPFLPCESKQKIFCQEISNEPISTVTTNITEQLHYDTWREIEQIYNELPPVSNKGETSNDGTPAQSNILQRIITGLGGILGK